MRMENPLARIQDKCEELTREHALVVLEKHGGALRNSYGNGITAALPAATFGDTLPWSGSIFDGNFSVEVYNPNRGSATAKNKERALKDGAVYLNKLGRRAILYAWFDTPALEYLCNNVNNHIVLSREESICRQIEDKARLQEHLLAAGCRRFHTPRSQTFPAANHLPDYEAIRKSLGETFVVQGRSMGGDGTKIIRTSEDYLEARNELRNAIRASEFVDAPYKSVYALAVPTARGDDVAVYVDGPSHKPVGIVELGNGAVAGAGGDWRPPHEAFDAEQLTKDVTLLAKYFYRQYGFYGHFVVEGFIRDGMFLFNEINARPGGGSEVNGDYQLQQGVPPFTLAHILARLGRLTAADLDEPNSYNYYAQQRALRGLSDGVFYLKYKNSFGQSITTSSDYRGSGIYQLDKLNGVLHWSREGITSRSADFNEGEILISNGPQSGAMIGAGKQVCSLEGMSGEAFSIFTTREQLTVQALRLVYAVKKMFPPLEPNQ